MNALQIFSLKTPRKMIPSCHPNLLLKKAESLAKMNRDNLQENVCKDVSSDTPVQEFLFAPVFCDHWGINE